MADRRQSKNVNDVPNGKLINILAEKYFKRGSSRAGRFSQQKKCSLCVYKDLFLRVLKLTKRPHMKYGKRTNKGTLKVR